MRSAKSGALSTALPEIGDARPPLERRHAAQFDAAANRAVARGLAAATPPSAMRRTATTANTDIRRVIRTRTPAWAAPICQMRHAAAVARVALERRLQLQIALQQIAAADFDARDRRLPLGRPRGAGDRAEPEMVEPRRGVEAWMNLVAAFDRCRPWRASGSWIVGSVHVLSMASTRTR